MFSERPEKLSYRARSGIYYIILADEFNRFQEAFNNLLRWADTSETQYSDSVDGFRILDTFLSDTISADSLSQLFKKSLRHRIPIKTLLINPNSQFARARNESLRRHYEGMISVEQRAKRGLGYFLEGLYLSTHISYDRDELEQLTYTELLSSITRISSERFQGLLELRFYTIVPSGPMFFFQDLLLSGFYCAGLSSKDLPWLIIVDDKNVTNDMYDVFSGEFRRIWEISSSNPEEQIEPEEEINQGGYFISYSSQNREVADHIELLLWRQNRLVIRDEQNFAPGNRISNEIRQKIANCQTFLVLCSQNHNQSAYCQGEIDIAFEQKKRIIVISLDGSKPVDIRLSNDLHLNGDNRNNRDLAIRRIIEDESKI